METNNIENLDILTNDVLLSDCQEPNEVIDLRNVEDLDEFMKVINQLSDEDYIMVKDSDSNSKD